MIRAQRVRDSEAFYSGVRNFWSLAALYHVIATGIFSIISLLHLPAAADFRTDEALDRLDDSELAKLSNGCSYWLRDAYAFESCLTTSAAKTLWRSCYMFELSIVETAYVRLQREAERRTISEPCVLIAAVENVVEMVEAAATALSDMISRPGIEVR